jgi:hypothetical protein
MPPDELSSPDLAGVVADAEAAGLAYVVIGGFSVVVNGYLRATEDSDLLVPGRGLVDARPWRDARRWAAATLHNDGTTSKVGRRSRLWCHGGAMRTPPLHT